MSLDPDVVIAILHQASSVSNGCSATSGKHTGQMFHVLPLDLKSYHVAPLGRCFFSLSSISNPLAFAPTSSTVTCLSFVRALHLLVSFRPPSNACNLPSLTVLFLTCPSSPLSSVVFSKHLRESLTFSANLNLFTVSACQLVYLESPLAELLLQQVQLFLPRNSIRSCAFRARVRTMYDRARVWSITYATSPFSRRIVR